MRDEILKKLSALSAEEQFTPVEDRPSQQSIYSKPGRFIIERRIISSISTGEATAAVCMRSHPRFRAFPSHTHDFIEIMYVCGGSITHEIGGRAVTVKAGDMIILGRDTRHSIKPSTISDIGINLIISADLFEVLLNTLRHDSSLNTRRLKTLLDRGDDKRFYLFRSSESVQISNLMESMIYSVVCKENIDGYVLEQSVKLLLCYLCSVSEDSEREESEDTYGEQTKKKIVKYIRSSYSTATLTEAAEMLGLSPTYLSRWIRRHFGVSFKELLMRERFAVASDLLRTTDLPIGDIFLHIGYENSSYFHKEFKKRFGMTPNNYRRAQ
ncbi:MAG: helix-turn-helix domain-containing protein [Clostridia bacterium]|nr:helix-turn-helix domain-containing protein [Clostridia bacterium]